MAKKPTLDEQTPLRPHTFDGIGEYDKKMPNWWLNVFYLTLAFGVLYWMAVQRFAESTPQSRVQDAMERIETIRLANSPSLDNASLWQMSRNVTFVEAGRKSYMANCTSCHGEDLKGGIGADLISDTWIHGGDPTQIFHTIENGVIAQGMQAWGPTLGSKRIAELTAFILSHHEPPTQ